MERRIDGRACFDPLPRAIHRRWAGVSSRAFFGFLLLLPLIVGLAGTARAGFELVSESPEVVELLWRLDAEAGAGQVGRDLPAIWVALPPGAEADLHAQSEGAVVLPSPFAAADLALVAASWPKERARLGAPTWVRDRYGAELAVRPFVLRPDGSVEAAEVIRVRVTIRDQGAPRRVGPIADPFSRLYDQIFVNAASSRAWHRPAVSAPVARGGDSFASTDAPWIRVRTSAEGVHEITGSDLTNLGVSLAGIDPATLRMFAGRQRPLAENLSVDEVPAWMEELAIAVDEVGGADGQFGPADRVLFLGHAADDWYVNKGVPATAFERFARDPYENHAVYWLTWGGSFSGQPARIAEIDGTGAVGPYVDRVRDRIHLEEDRISSSRQRELGLDAADWEQYWWRSLETTETDSSAQNVTVEVPSAVTADPVEVFARFWGDNAPESPGAPDHDLRVDLNGHVLGRHQWDGRTRRDLSVTGNWLVPGKDQRFQLVGLPWPDPVGSRLDIVLLAFIELTYTRLLEVEGGELAFFAGGLSGPQPLSVTGFAAGLDADDVWVLDADDPFRPSRVRGDLVGSAYRFRADLPTTGVSRYVVSTDAAFRRPELELRPRPADGYLRDRSAAAQLVIITHADFAAAAEDLAAYRRTNFPDRTTAEVAVVDVEEIFDEFSYGRRDPVAIRNFLQYIRHRWDGGVPEDGPAYVLLLGDAHRDHRGHVTTNPTDFVPSYTRYYDSIFTSSIYDPRFASDDYLCLLDGPQDTGMDLYVGRLVAQTAAQAAVMVEKTMAYEQESALGAWRSEVTLVADDVCQGIAEDQLGYLHMRQTETLAQRYIPASISQRKIFLYEYGSECIYTNKQDVAADLRAAMNEGTLVVNYTGHGGETQISDERIFEISNVGSLTNDDRLFFMVCASCSIGKFEATSESLAEALMRYPNGGTVGIFAASAVAFASGNALVNQLFFQVAFPDSCAPCSRPVGEAAVVAKLLLDSTGLNQRRYALHGDPCVALATPRAEVALSLADGVTGAPVGGELRRGTLLAVSGEVRDVAGTLLEDFDGTASIRVYDSELVRRPSADLRYELAGAPIYRGSAEVENGRFTTRFLVPSSLRSGTRGDAQIYVYVEDGARDGAGALVDLVVPETVAPPSSDTQGPRIELAFAGDGDVLAPEAAYTVALFDSSGINVTGLSPSRSTVLRLEQDGVTILAEDLSAQVVFGEDFRSATIEHRLPANLPDGTYEAELRAYDNLNFGSSVRTSFALASSGRFEFDLGRLYNVPNPMERGTQFFAEIPEEADVEIEIFTLSGRRIRTLGPVRLSAEAARSAGIAWDGRDDDGDRPANGVYFYKVKARSVRTGEDTSGIGRLAVSR